jgi:imidazolonepropionase-like amidohydrolase
MPENLASPIRKRVLRCRLIWVGLFCLLPVTATSQSNSVLVIAGAQIVDGTAAPPIQDGVVIIEGNRIRTVGPRSGIEIPAGARVIEARGATILPGLADLHGHSTFFIPSPRDFEDDALSALRAAAILRQALDAGITLVRDSGARNTAGAALKHAIEEGYIEGPRFVICNNIVSSTGGHGSDGELMLRPKWLSESDSPEEWRKHIRWNFKMGADYIKVTPPYTFDEVRLAAEEAHNFGARLAVDATGQDYPGWMLMEHAVAAGADTIEHLAPMKDEAKVIAMMRERRTIVVPTLESRRRRAETQWKTTTEREIASRTTSKDYEDRFRKLHAAGIRMAIGTDINGQDQGQIGLFYQDELQIWLDWGYSAHEVIQAATRVGAEAAGLDEELGTLEPGKLADAIVVPGDPLQDITVVTRPVMVIKDGKVIREREKGEF